MPLDESGSRERYGLELDEPVIDAPGRLLGFVNAFGGWACRPPPDALRPGSGNRNGERRSGVGARRSSPRVLFSGSNQMGVGERRSSARRRVPGKLLWEGTGEERSPATGHVVSDQPGGNCDAIGSARSVVASKPERVESALPLLFVQQLCRSRGETAGACHALQPQCEETAKQVTAPPVCPIGKGMPGMPSGPGCHLLTSVRGWDTWWSAP